LDEQVLQMTRDNNIRVEAFTRQEFRDGREKGYYRAAILALGSIEQHLEHLAVAQDTTSSLLVAERAAERLYPDVLVAAPIAVGISEHHMGWGPTISVSPQAWLAIVYEATESLVRHGVTKVLLLNGHGGNVAPVAGVMEQWRTRLYASWTDAGRLGFPNIQEHLGYVDALESSAGRELDVRFHSYWDLISDDVRAETMVSKAFPGHAGEFETSVAMHAFPQDVRTDSMDASGDPSLAEANADKGQRLLDAAIDGTAGVLKVMLGD
jgi:creatinine amidohydrolase